MTDRHKRAPVAFRPPEDDEKWLRDHAAATGASIGAILTTALAVYRDQVEEFKRNLDYEPFYPNRRRLDR